MILETINKYYLIPNLASANPAKRLSSKIRIAQIPDNFPFIPQNFIGHLSIRHLKRNEERWKELKKISSKKADKICEEQFILDFHDFVLTPYDKTFNEYAFDLLQHSIYGKYDNEFKGVHLFCEFNKDIIDHEQTKKEDKNQVWEAKIKVYNKLRNKTYEKVSTFFPRSWTPTQFMFESFEAINRIVTSPEIIEYKSVTTSGIPVVIIIKNGRAKTIYPVYQE